MIRLPVRNDSDAPAVLLGVDGGGSKTRAVVAALDGRVLGAGTAGSSNQHRVGFAAACRAVTEAVEAALSCAAGAWGQGAAASRPRVAAACLGLASVDRPADVERFREWAATTALGAACRVVNDAELLLAAGEGWGVALVAGTGSACFARGRDGRTARAGGWGYVLGDEGSGYYLGVQALRLAAQSADGRRDAAAVLRMVLEQWHIERPEQLLDRVYGGVATQREIATLAAPLLALAGAGDEAAAAALHEAAADLARHVDAVARRLDLQQPPLALGGGLLCASARLREELLVRLRVAVGPVAVVHDPAQGALALARGLLDESS